MEPVLISASALATLLLTKMLEKAAEKLGEKLPDLSAEALKQMSKLKQLLWHQDPQTAEAIEQVVYQPQLVEQQPENYSLDVLTKKMESMAQTNPEVAEVVAALAAAVTRKVPVQVRQQMGHGINVQGSFEAGKMIQQAPVGASSIEQTMLEDVKVGKGIKVSDLSQG